jgi:hypothetical protein
MAAALAAAAIVIALFAVFVAIHNGPVGSVPATPDKSVRAYQALINADYTRMNGSTSTTCATILDPTCAATFAQLTAAVQIWVDDLNAFHTPARYAVIDGQLRRHLTEFIADLNAELAFQKANNQAGFDLASTAANYERAWVDPTTFAIEGSYSRVAANYHDAVKLAKQSLDACVAFTPAPGDLGCSQLMSGQTCISTGLQNCENYVEGAGAQIQTFLIALLQNQPPTALAAKDAQLRADLAQADTDLLTITRALLTGDSVQANAAQRAFYTVIVSADNDTSAILAA